MKKIKQLPTHKDLKIFALIIFIAFIIYNGFIPFWKNEKINYYFLIAGLTIFIIGLFFPKILIHPRNLWIHIGNLLAMVNNIIIFSIIYFLIFTFIRLIFILSKRDRLKRKFKGISSTMVIKNQISSFTDPF